MVQSRVQIHRVVNLRIEGAKASTGTKTTAEAVLLLRSYYKAGRWNHLERQALTTTTGIATVDRKKWMAPGRGDLNLLITRPIEYLCSIGCQDARAGCTVGVAVEDEDEREQCPVLALLVCQVSMAGTVYGGLSSK